jgi:lysophospholipase L1-like esterase
MPLTEAEDADPYCLSTGESEALLAGHPWRRFVVVGDSVAEGWVEPLAGYPELAWADRVAAELTAARPELVYLNLGQSNRRADQVRAEQLDRAVAFGPDLALVACGGIDALRATYQPAAVDAELIAIVTSLQDVGADVITLAQFDVSRNPYLEEWARAGIRKRYAVLAEQVTSLGKALSTIHVNLAGHPLNEDPSMHSTDRRHGNARCHAVAAAETVRQLGAAIRAHTSW